MLCFSYSYVFSSLAKQYNLPVTEEPLVFMKPTTSYIKEGQSIIRPKKCERLVYEVELGVVIGKKGRNIREESALDHVGGYVLALDMTAKDLQDKATSTGAPWFLGKGFDTFTPVSRLIEPGRFDYKEVRLWLEIDGERKQDESTTGMIFSIPRVIAYVSEVCTLEVGDLILTGTPSGAGVVEPGQAITCGLGEDVRMKFPVE
jgi:acylpyruvate hydrolase